MLWTTEAFETWVRAAKPGEKIKYHRGFLGADRHEEGGKQRINALADVVYEEGIWDRVMCVQEKHGELDTSYYAVKTAYNRRFETGVFIDG